MKYQEVHKLYDLSGFGQPPELADDPPRMSQRLVNIVADHTDQLAFPNQDYWLPDLIANLHADWIPYILRTIVELGQLHDLDEKTRAAVATLLPEINVVYREQGLSSYAILFDSNVGASVALESLIGTPNVSSTYLCTLFQSH